jgi:3-dehydroquinate dehydratase-2
MRILLINGPNLNTLGTREPDIYGKTTLPEIEAKVREKATSLGLDLVTFQSNSEGALIDFIQAESPNAAGIIINPGALTHYSFALRDALAASGLSAVEVHISNIYGREHFRRRSVTAASCRGLVAGLGWRGYVVALESLAAMVGERGSE